MLQYLNWDTKTFCLPVGCQLSAYTETENNTFNVWPKGPILIKINHITHLCVTGQKSTFLLCSLLQRLSLYKAGSMFQMKTDVQSSYSDEKTLEKSGTEQGTFALSSVIWKNRWFSQYNCVEVIAFLK